MAVKRWLLLLHALNSLWRQFRLHMFWSMLMLLLIYFVVTDMILSDCWLQKGCEMLGLSDMAMPDQLYLYMVGGHKRPMVNI